MNLKYKKVLFPFLHFWKILGPGLITGASDDDPSGIATYSQAGAAYGLSTLWTALITFPLMASIQEMCARIGMVTSQGLTGVIKTHYSKTILKNYPTRDPEINFTHAAKQAYIGLGTALIAAAYEQVDCTPMEGFDPAALDVILKLKEKGLRSVLMLPLGYRQSDEDWLVNLKKVRRPTEDFVINVK